MNHLDDEIYRKHSDFSERKGYVEAHYQGTVEEEDYQTPALCEQFHELKDGDEFDLGDVTVVMYACPGHTPGSMTALIREDRMLLLGDACNKSTFLFGPYDERVMKIAKDCGIQYARTAEATGDFEISENLLALKVSARHRQKDLLEIVHRFLATRPEKPQLLYIWGHSYEFETDKNWDVIEEVCGLLSGRKDIFYGTNSEVLLPVAGSANK